MQKNINQIENKYSMYNQWKMCLFFWVKNHIYNLIKVY